LHVTTYVPTNRLCNAWQGHLTPEQEQKLEAMRKSFPESAAWHTDHDLLRFLRARSFDLQAARKMYSKYCLVVRACAGPCVMSQASASSPAAGACCPGCALVLQQQG
jgi:CRAL/TRIO, N-terminal domain